MLLASEDIKQKQNERTITLYVTPPPPTHTQRGVCTPHCSVGFSLVIFSITYSSSMLLYVLWDRTDC